MRLITLAAVALSAVAGTIPSSVTASPPGDGPKGRLCSYSASSDPSPEAGEDSMVGQINGGPVVGEPGGELVCTLQVDNNTHSGPDVVVRSSGPADSTGVSVVAAADVSYVSPSDAQDYLCVSYKKPDGSTVYWHPHDTKGDLDPTNDEPGHWTSDPNKPCSAATQFSSDPVEEAIDALVVCPLLAAAHVPMGFSDGPGNPSDDAFYIDYEGDAFIDLDGDGVREVDALDEWVWDCPVYISDVDATHKANSSSAAPAAIIDW